MKNIKFLLRRIENEIEFEKSIALIIKMIKENEIEYHEIEKVIESSIFKKNYVLNALAVSLYENEHYDFVIPFFRKALEYDSTNYNTLFNLSYVLTAFGLYNEALNCLSYISDPTTESEELEQYIRKELSNEQI